MPTKETASKSAIDLTALLSDRTFLTIPKIGDVVKGKIISIARNEVRIDIENYRTGVIRGGELIDPSREYSNVKEGDEVEATVVELENEHGEVELSFRFAGHRKAWDMLNGLFQTGELTTVKVVEASKGGLLVRLNYIPGFLPVSQLAPDNYPRVSGGDKSKILEKLKTFVGQDFEVKIIDVHEEDEKLIVSEKAVWEEKQKSVIAKYNIGDVVNGEVSALADFGAFVRFDILEGLVHISEIAWQRIDHPRDLLKVGDPVKAEVIGIEGSKIFLSIKKLIDDPWRDVGKKYTLGQKVTGKVLKVNPFGFFVELDPEIHGLAHISELSDTPVTDPGEIASVGDEVEFTIVSIEPQQHRLGLSLKTQKPEEEENKVVEPEKKSPKSEEATAEQKAEETPAEEEAKE